jgi:hypothetical protein
MVLFAKKSCALDKKMPQSVYIYPTATTLAGQYRQVFEGRADRTRSGLTKRDLTISKSGKIVSKLKSKSGKTRQEPLAMWRQAVSEAAAELKVKYTIPKKGTPFYTLSRQKYDALISALDLYQTESEGDSTTDYSSSGSDE